MKDSNGFFSPLGSPLSLLLIALFTLGGWSLISAPDPLPQTKAEKQTIDHTTTVPRPLAKQIPRSLPKSKRKKVKPKKKEIKQKRLPSTNASKSSQDDDMDGWDFSDSRLTYDEVRPWLRGGHPAAIHYRDINGLEVYKNPLHPGGSGTGVGQTLVITSAEAMDQAITDRDARLKRREKELKKKKDDNKDKKEDDIPKDAIAVRNPRFGISYKPGKVEMSTESGVKFQVKMEQHPDFASHYQPYTEDEYLRSAITDKPDYDLTLGGGEFLKETVVSMGHGGSITFEVQNGTIRNKVGTDFTIYENVFEHRVGSFFHEFAYVSVSEDGNHFYQFHCEPHRARAKHARDQEEKIDFCVGSYPDGDRFDLEDLRTVDGQKVHLLNGVRYVRITDKGDNPNLESSYFNYFTEGADIDAFEMAKGSVYR